MHETFAKQTLGVSALKRIFPPKIRLVVQRELFRDLDSARCPCASFSAETCRADTIPPRSRDIAARAKGLSQCRKSPCGFHFIYISPAGPPERKIPPPRPSVRPLRSPFRRRPAFYLPPALLDGVSTSKRAPRAGAVCRAL